MTATKSKPDFELTTDTPYLTLTGKLWGVYYENFYENWHHTVCMITTHSSPWCTLMSCFGSRILSMLHLPSLSAILYAASFQIKQCYNGNPSDLSSLKSWSCQDVQYAKTCRIHSINSFKTVLSLLLYITPSVTPQFSTQYHILQWLGWNCWKKYKTMCQPAHG